MPEVIGLEDLTTDFEQTLKQALAENGFEEFRCTPRLKTEAEFLPKLHGMEKGFAHFFSVPAGYELKDLPVIMEKRMIRSPKDIREAINVGKTLANESEYEHCIFAPEITGAPAKLLRIVRYPEWRGPGFIINTFDPDDEKLWDMNWIGFSSLEG